MGAGASTASVSSLHSVFSNAEVTKASKCLVRDETLRESFILFIKSSVWLDTLVHYFPTVKTPLTHEDRLVKETNNILYAFKQPKEKRISLEGVCASGDTKPPSPMSIYSVVLSHRSSRSNRTVAPKKYIAPETHCESYVNIEDCSLFQAEELLGVFLNILFPIYLTSDFYARYLKHGIEHGKEAAIDETSFSYTPPVVNKLTMRSQELLLGSAAYFDESVLHDHLVTTSWVDSAASAMDIQSLCVTLLDTTTPETRIVYANKAFYTLTNYTSNEVIGKTLRILNGENTDKAQCDQITSALHSTSLSKFATTHYTKTNKSFLNLLTIRSCGKYSIAVHFPGTKTAKLDDLKVVDDLVVYLTCLLTPPPCPSHTVPPAPQLPPSPKVSRGAVLMRQFSKLVPSPMQGRHKTIGGSGKGSNKSSVGGVAVNGIAGSGVSGVGSSSGSDKGSIHSLHNHTNTKITKHLGTFAVGSTSGSGKSSDGTVVGVLNRENSGGSMVTMQTIDTVPAMPLISGVSKMSIGSSMSSSISASTSDVSTLTSTSVGFGSTSSVVTSPIPDTNTNNTSTNTNTTDTNTNSTTAKTANGIASHSYTRNSTGNDSTFDASSKKDTLSHQVSTLSKTEKM